MRKFIRKILTNLVRATYKEEDIAQKDKEKQCLYTGHLWASTFVPNEEIKGTIAQRTICKRCGVGYHEHKYYNIHDKKSIK